MSENPPASEVTDSSDQIAVRRSKRERLLARGEEPYPVSVPVTATIAEVRAEYGHLEAGVETDDEVGVSGGRRGLSIRLSPDDLVAFLGATLADITQ